MTLCAKAAHKAVAGKGVSTPQDYFFSIFIFIFSQGIPSG